MGKKCVPFVLSSKNSLFLSLVLLVMIVLGPSLLYSQPQICYPDCDTTIWVPAPPAPPMIYHTFLVCGEPVDVSYRMRTGCGMFWDVFMEGITFVNGDSGLSHCSGMMSVQNMVENAMINLIMGNPMHFPPTD